MESDRDVNLILHGLIEMELETGGIRRGIGVESQHHPGELDVCDFERRDVGVKLTIGGRLAKALVTISG